MQTPLWLAAISAAGEEMAEGLERRFGKEETVPLVFLEANTLKHGERFRASSKFPETHLILLLVRGVFELHTLTKRSATGASRRWRSDFNPS